MSLASFGVRKPVVVNLLMLAVLGAGVIFGLSLRREFFPEVRPRAVLIAAPYPGASPEEVESALTIKIEDAISTLDGIDEITSTSTEGLGALTVVFEERVNIDDAVEEVQREIDALQDLPEFSDRITVERLEPNLPAISLAIFGDAPERVLKDEMRRIQADLESLPGVGELALGGVRADEIRVEADPAALVEHGLSLPDLSRRVGDGLRELPGGSVRGATSSVALRTLGTEERADAIGQVIVRTYDNGRSVRLREIAEVRETLVDTALESRLNGKPAANLTVFSGGGDDIVEMAETVKAYVAGRNAEKLELTLPERVRLTIAERRAESAASRGGQDPPVWEGEDGEATAAYIDLLQGMGGRLEAYALGLSRSDTPPPGTLTTTTDLARFVVGRLDLLTRNALQGGALVFLTLVLLLNWRISFWVAAGLVVSLSGTLAVMYFLDITLNLLTMFGLIIVIGILVDDAIVVAENITARHEAGLPALEAGIRGTDQVAWPVVATVLTTVFAFLPLGLIQGQIGDFLEVLPIVVACALGVSLVECLLILPSHMAHSLKAVDREHEPGRRGWFVRAELGAERARAWFFDRLGAGYLRLLAVSLRLRYISLGIAAALVVVSGGLVAGNVVGFIFFEDDDAETVDVSVRLPTGSSLEETEAIVSRIEEISLRQPEIASVFVQIGATTDVSGDSGAGTSRASGNVGQLIFELVPVEQREARGQRPSNELISDIREELGPVAGVDTIRFSAISGGPSGAALSFTVTGQDPARIDEAVERVKAAMGDFDGVIDISDNADAGAPELRFVPNASGRALGFTEQSLGGQVQGFVFGLEAFTFAGEREDVDVRVMLPEAYRRSLAALERVWVFTPGGRAVPLGEVADIEEGQAYASVRRLDRRRAVEVQADVLSGVNPDEVASSLEPMLREIAAEVGGVTILKRGRQEDFNESFSTLPLGMIVAASLIFVVLAWLFQSYTQPLVVMTAIPFAIIGMILGHWIMGYRLTFLSLIGFVALSGIVVNDSLIFMEFFNHMRSRGLAVYEAAVAAGRARLRAIVLTTVTTVLGLLPLMLEQSFQARFLIPMAITIAFGLLSATLIVLVVLPCLLLVFDDAGRLWRFFWKGEAIAPRPYPPVHEVLQRVPKDLSGHG